MRLASLLPVALLVFVGFAGCADSGKSDEPTQMQIQQMVRGGKGAVTGIILNHNNQPFKYLLVKLFERGTANNEPVCMVETSPNGKFWCGQIFPGQYYIWYNLKDWKNVNVEVYAGKYTNVTIDFAHYGPTAR